MRMKQSGPREHNKEKEQQQMRQDQFSMRPKLSNYSIASEVSFSTENKKPKSKSFNRRQTTSEQDLTGLIKIYKDLQYSQQMRNLLKKFCYLEKQKLYKLSVTELKQSCERELRRFDNIKKNNVQLQRFLHQEDLEDTDNQLSLITITCQVRALADAKKDLNSSTVSNSESMIKVRLRQYESILLEVEKSDEIIKNFINTRLKLLEPKEINIQECKTFFKRQASIMSKSSDRLILSRKTLCEIIIFLCRLLQGEILAFDDVYEYQEEELQTYEIGDENNKTVVYNKTIKNNQTIVQNLDQSFSQEGSQKEIKMQSFQSINTLSQKELNSQSRSRVYKDYSIDDLGKKVHQLAGICEQIPQLQAFTRTLKFSKITLDNRESFFKIVDVIIALHHKIGYLSRNKPTLLREIETIESDLTEVYQSIRQFVASLTEDVPQFKELQFKNENDEDHKHQLTQTISYLRKDLKKLSEVLKQQNSHLQFLQKKIQLVRQIVQCFCQTLHDDEQTQWRDFVHKIMARNLGEDENLILNWLNECHANIIAGLKSGHKHHEELQTQRNLQAEVHTLLEDYERLRGEHQQLQNKYSALADQKDEHLFDIEQRNKIITNLTAIKIAAQKRQKILKDQLIQSQNDAQRYENDLGILEQQLQMLSIQNQNRINDLMFQHQNEVRELVDKISNLERAKMDILNKYETECSKSIRLLQDGSSSNSQIQALKDRLDRKTKQVDQNQRKFKDSIHLLEKQLQELKNQKGLTENRLQLAQKNKNKLINKLQQLNSKHNKDNKELQEKYEEEIRHMKEQLYKLEKEVDKFKRNNDHLSEEVEHLKSELNSQMRAGNDYRQKFMQLNPLQAQYQTLAKQYERMMDNFHKSQINCDNYKQKCFDLSVKHEELIETHTRDKELLKKAEKKQREAQSKLEELLVTYDGLDGDFKQQLKVNKFQNKKISELQHEIESLQQSLKDKDKSYSTIMGKSQTKYKLINQQLTGELERHKLSLKTINSALDEKDKQIRNLEKTINQLNNDLHLKELDYDKLKGQMEKRLKQKSSQLQLLEMKNRSLQEQSYNQTVMLQQMKTEKLTLQSRLAQLEPLSMQYDQMKNKLQSIQQNESKLKNKVNQLELQNRDLKQENDKLRLNTKQLQNELKNIQQQLKRTKQELRRKQDLIQQQQNQQRIKQEQMKINSITEFKQQILIQKTIIINQNNKLHQQNNILQQEVQKLKLLNEALQRSIKKLQQTLAQAKQQHQLIQNQLKQTISKHLFTINSLQSQLTTTNLEKQSITKDYQQLQSKCQTKTKQLAEKDHLLFEMELQKGNYEKVIKQYKLKNAQLQNLIQQLNQIIQKLKSGKIKNLQNQITQLNDLLNEYKRKQQQARINSNDLQNQLDKLKRDFNKKLQALKQEKIQLEEYYQNQIKKLTAQHQLELNAVQNKTRKDTQNEYNQLLIKEKENLNNLTISKMEELGEMQKKYERLIRQERAQKNLLQQDYNNLEREFNEFKRTKSQAYLKPMVNEEEKNQTLEELQKLKLQFEALKRENVRLNQQSNRLAIQNSSVREQNGGLSSKLIESQHMVTILQSKVNLLTQSVENMKKSLQEMSRTELQKLNLQRENEKLRNKALSDESRLSDCKSRIQEMQQRIIELEGKLKQYRNREFDWQRNTSSELQRIRLLTSQGNDMTGKLNEMKVKISEMSSKLSQSFSKLQSTQSQLKSSQKKYRQKQLQLQQIKQQLSNQISLLQQLLAKKTNAIKQLQQQFSREISQWQSKFSDQMTEWQRKQNQIRKEIKQKDNKVIQLDKKIKQLEFALEQYQADNSNNTNQNKQLIDQLSKAKWENLQLKGTIDDLNRTIQKSNKKLNELNTQLQQAKLQIQSLGGVNNELRIKIKDNQQLIQQLQRSLQQHQQTIRHLEQTIISLKQLNQQLQKTLNNNTQHLSINKQSHKNDINNLRQQYQTDKQQLLSKHQYNINLIQQNLTKTEQKLNELNEKYKGLLLQNDQLNKMIQKLRRENMQLSSHCQTYEERIQILEIKQKENGKRSFEIETKYLQTEVEITRLEEQKNLLQKQLQKYKNQTTNSNQKFIELQTLNQRLEDQNTNLTKKLTEAQRQIERLNKLCSQLQQQITSLQQQIQRLNQSYNNLHLNLQNAERQNQGLLNDNKNLYEHLQNAQRQIDKITKENNSLKQDLSNAELEISRLNDINGQLNINNSQLSLNLQSIKQQLQKANDQYSILHQNLLLKEQQTQRLQQQIYSYQHSANGSSEEIEKLLGEIRSLRQQISQQSGQITLIQQQKDKALMNIVNSENLNQQLRNQNIQLQQKLYTVNLQNDKLIKENNNLEQKLKALNQQLDYKLNSLNQEVDRLRNQNTHLQQKLNSLNQQIDQLRINNSNLQQTINSLTNELTKLQKTNDDLQKKLSQTQGLLNWERNQTALQRRNIQLAQQRIHELDGQNKFCKDKIFELEQQRNRRQIDLNSLLSELENYKIKVRELESLIEKMQNQQKLNQNDRKTQQTYQIQRLRAELALTRQQLLRVNEIIRRKDQDFTRQLKKLNEEKAQMWKDNQGLVQEYQLFKNKYAQLQGAYQSLSQQYQTLNSKYPQLQTAYQQKSNDFQRQKRQKQRLSHQVQRLRAQISQKVRQLATMSQELSQSRLRQQQLTRTLIKQQTEIRRVSLQIESYKVKISAVANENEETKLIGQKKLKEQIAQLQRENARLMGQLSLTRLEYERLSGQNSKLSGQSLTISQFSESLKEENGRLKQEVNRLTVEINVMGQQNSKLVQQLKRLSQQLNKSNQQLKTSNQQLSNSNQQVSRLEQQLFKLNQQLSKQKAQTQRFKQQSLSKQQTIAALRNDLNKITSDSNTISSNIRQQLDKAFKQIESFRLIIQRLQNQNLSLKKDLNNKESLIKKMQDNVDKGKDLLASADKELKLAAEEKIKLNKSIADLTKERDNLLLTIRIKQGENTSLSSTITILQTKIATLQKQIHTYETSMEQQMGQSRSSINLVTKSYSYQGGQFAELNRLQDEIKRLVKEIQHKDQTIKKNIIEIQRLNKEVKTLKQQIHLLSEGKTISIKGYTRVTNPHDTSLNTKGVVYTEYDVKEMKTKIDILEKSVSRYQDRETQLLREIEKYKFRERAHLEQIRVLTEKVRKNSVNNGEEMPQLMTSNSGVKKTSFDENYNNNRENQPKSSTYRLQTGIQFTQRSINMTKKQVQKSFMRVEGQQLRKTIERISRGQQLMGSKIDEILDQSKKISRESLQQIMMNNQFNLSANIVSEIRDLIHQNKALIETMRSLKEYREDVTLLIQEYIDPELLTQFAYRILTYFSQVEEQSPQALQIRQQLNAIRKNNIGGYYFTVLEEYTKYILENNSIEIYKEELRQKARELISFKEKFQALIDSKLQENTKLLNKSDSRNSLHNKSRSKYMSSSRGGSETEREGSRLKQYTVVTSRTNLNPQDNYPPRQPNTEQKVPVITVNQPQIKTVTSRITYTPYTKQPITTQIESPITDVRSHVVYSTTTSSNYISNQFSTVNSSNSNITRNIYERK